MTPNNLEQIWLRLITHQGDLMAIHQIFLKNPYWQAHDKNPIKVTRSVSRGNLFVSLSGIWLMIYYCSARESYKMCYLFGEGAVNLSSAFSQYSKMTFWHTPIYTEKLSFLFYGITWQMPESLPLGSLDWLLPWWIHYYKQDWK